MFSRPRRTGFRILPVARRSRFAGSSAPAGGGGSYWTGTVRTTDGSVSDVQAKINAASSGDILEIPSGSFSWSTGVTVSGGKGVLIRGQGSGRVLGYHNASGISIGTGSKSFTFVAVPGQPAPTNGQTLRAWVNGGERNSGGSGTGEKPWMEGTVTSYSGGTLTLNVTSTSGHSMTKRLWIIATGPTTTITNNTGATGRLMSLGEGTTIPNGVTGIRFEAGTVSENANHIHITSNTGGKPTLVFDNWLGVEGSMIAVESLVNRGVVYNNTFARFNWVNSVGECFKLTGASDSWSTVSTMGVADTDGTKNFYFETNDIHAMVTTVDIDDYGRGVVRYNLLNESACGGSHGADTSNYGVRHQEFNHNTFVRTVVGGSPDLETFDLNRAFLIRGGTGTIYANVIPNLDSSAWGTKDEIQLQIQNLDRNAGPNACWGANIAGNQYPCPRQIGMGYVTGSGTDGLGRSNDGYTYVGDLEPMYIWGNTGSGGAISVLTGYESASECTNPDLASNYIQLNRDYYTSTKPGYVEYEYPHPLRSEAT